MDSSARLGHSVLHCWALALSWVPVIPILSIIASFVLIVSLPGLTLLRFAVWLLIGLVIYFLYGKRKSHLEREPDEAAEIPRQDIA